MGKHRRFIRRSSSSDEDRNFRGTQGLSDDAAPNQWSRDAASNVFHLLRKSRHYTLENGLRLIINEIENNDHITRQELLDKLTQNTEEIHLFDDEVDDIDSDIFSTPTEEEIPDFGNETNFVESVNSILESTNDKQGISHPLLQNVTKYSVLKLNAFMDYLITKLQQQWKTIFYMLLPMHQIQILITVCLAQLISTDSLLKILPVITCYLTFGAMMLYTLKMFKEMNMSRQREIWYRILRTLSPDTNRDGGYAEPMESRFSTISWDPYANFFISLILFVLSLGMAIHTLPNSILFFIVAVLFTCLCFVSLAGHSDIFALAAIAGNFVSCVPAMSKSMKSRFGLLSIWQPFFEYRYYSLHLSFGLPSLALFIVPISFILLAKRQKKLSALQLIVPHIVCLCWADIAFTIWLISYRRFQISGIFLAFTLIFLFLSPSIMSIAIAVLLSLVQLAVTIEMRLTMMIVVSVFVTLLPFILVKFYRHLRSKYGWGARSRQPVRASFISLSIYAVVLIVAISVLYNDNGAFSAPAEMTNLTWKHFNRNCLTPDSNTIESQINCSKLKGTSVDWKGTVKSVRISGIDNSFETLIDYLPEAIIQFVRCFYDLEKSDTQHLKTLSVNQCSLSSHNVYTFELDVSGPFGEHHLSSNKGQIVLLASNVFAEMLMMIDEGDVIQFVGYFDRYPIFNYPPRLRLLQLSCLTCRKLLARKDLKYLHRMDAEFSRHKFWAKVLSAVEFTFNFIFSPLCRLSA